MHLVGKETAPVHDVALADDKPIHSALKLERD